MEVPFVTVPSFFIVDISPEVYNPNYEAPGPDYYYLGDIWKVGHNEGFPGFFITKIWSPDDGTYEWHSNLPY